ncbi:hypothetical protein A2U01_0097742 [Trifolium medium]|nr:hypothetical protein [Trifolium medium]
MIRMVLKRGWMASKESLELCIVWMSIRFCLEVTFSTMKLIIGREMRSKGWKLVELLEP